MLHQTHEALPGAVTCPIMSALCGCVTETVQPCFCPVSLEMRCVQENTHHPSSTLMVEPPPPFVSGNQESARISGFLAVKYRVRELSE